MTRHEEIVFIHELLKDHIIRNLPRSKRIHDDEYVTECVFCGDSENKSHAHLYIGFKENGLVAYDCKRCPAKGYFTLSMLERLQVHDERIKSFFSRKRKFTTINKNSFSVNQLKSMPKYEISKIIDAKDIDKIKYFENRTGIKVNKETVETYSLVLNLYDFLKHNEINLNNYSQETQYVIKHLAENCIGFLSANKRSIQFRAVRKTNFSKNKFNFVINPSIKLPFYYRPKTPLDIMALNPKIVLAEGPFDIICIKKRFFTEDNNDTVFCAVGGKSNYKKILKEVLSITGYLNAEVMVFSDEDVSLQSYSSELLSQYKNLLKISVIYNTESKDFGDINLPVKFRMNKI